MANWKKAFTQFGHKAEEKFDKLKYDLEKRLGSSKPIQIVPYMGYGTSDEVWIRGRVLKDKGIRPVTDKDTTWDNLLRMYKRFESDEVPGIDIHLEFGDVEENLTTDEEGYFETNLRLPHPPDTNRLWHEVRLELLKHEQKADAVGQILIPPEKAEFGVISDIDDTIIKTGATDLLEMARNTFLKNAMTRLPFDGVGEFYQALQKGRSDKPSNPIFYLSNSPWNLYDLLTNFMKLNNIPESPVLLRDFGLDEDKFIKDDTHKARQIHRLLATYPDIPFVLIGDSGEHDPEICQQAVKDFPGRFRAIYIRDVTSEERDNAVKKIAENVSGQGTEMLLVQDTKAAAEHATSQGLIR